MLILKIISFSFLFITSFSIKVSLFAQKNDTFNQNFINFNKNFENPFGYYYIVNKKALLSYDTSSYSGLCIIKYLNNDTIIIDYTSENDFYFFDAQEKKSYLIKDSIVSIIETSFKELYNKPEYFTPLIFNNYLENILKELKLKDYDSIDSYLFVKESNHNKPSYNIFIKYGNKIPFVYQTSIKLDTLYQYVNTTIYKVIKDSLELNRIISKCIDNIKNNKTISNENNFKIENNKFVLSDINIITKINPKIEDINNKFTLVYFWYLGCYPCRFASESINNLYKEFGNFVNFQAINCYDKDKKKVEKYLIDKKYNYPCLLSNKTESIETITIFPTILILNKNNDILERIEGFNDDFEINLKRLLTKYITN